MKNSTEHGVPGPEKVLSERVLFGTTLFFGFAMWILAAVFNTAVLTLLSPNRHLLEETVARIHRAQFWFAVLGASLIGLAIVCRNYGTLAALARKPKLTNVALMAISFVVFAVTINNFLSVRYFPKKKISTFMKDDKLGWKFTPNSRDKYIGVEYAINARGLRSPHADYEKPANTKRILQLGDSATVGNRLPYEGTTAFLLEEMFRRSIDDYSVQVINAACDGYSPWQEYELLKSEGIKYDPDLVTVGFVLNDVTGKFHLKRFGGRDGVSQLALAEGNTVHTKPWLQRIIARTPLYLFLKDIYFKVRFGRNTMAGLRKLEEIQVKDLLESPESDIVLQAWQMTLENLAKIVRFCSDRGLELVILHIPSIEQFIASEIVNDPRQILGKFCERHGVGFIDVFEVYAEDMKKHNRTHEYYFKQFEAGGFDPMHPSIEGNKIIAQTIHGYVMRQKLLGNRED